MSRKDPTANDAVRVGKVTAVFPERHTVTVELKDRFEGLVTQELPVMTPFWLKAFGYGLPDVGTQVACLFYGNGIAEGFVAGAIPDRNTPPPIIGDDKFYFRFKDGATILYDTETHDLSIELVDGGKIKVNGSLHVSGDVIDGGRNTNHHSH